MTPRVDVCAMALILAAASGAAAQTTQDLKHMSLEDLLQVDVTTVTRAPEPIMRVPAGVYLITQEDLRRSGALSIPEVLRLAPGLQVARIGAGTWSVGMRGFADRLARSILVLIDGRAVYSPLFAGTYWETQDTLLQDIDRIEIIRGPGGTLWGANAVNGIINIITKAASQSAGLYTSVGGGSQERAYAGFRYGGSAGEAWHYRVYGKAVDRVSQYHPDSLDYDGFSLGQGGFRADWTPVAVQESERRGLTIQGDIYDARLGERPTVTTYTPPFAVPSALDAPLSGGNALLRYTAPFASLGRFQLQTFYARTNRDELPVKENRDTFDVDFQQTPLPWRRHQLVWGLGYRVSSGRITSVPPTVFEPGDRTDTLFSGFVQDEIALVPNRLRVTIGSKFEHNDFSGGELQPGVRVAWIPRRNQTLWGAVTRAVRTPSRVETDYSTTSLLNPAVPLFVRLLPDAAFKPETLVAYETGYRIQPVAPVYVSMTGFYNRLGDVLSTEIGPAFAETAASPPRLIVPVVFGNGLAGNSYGVELTADVRAATWWRWTANYSYLRIQLSRQPGSVDGSQERRDEGLSPSHQLQLQSSIDLLHGWSVDVFGRYISELPAGPVPGYATADLRVACQITRQLEIALIGRDLGSAHHLEWPTGAGANIEIRRSFFVKMTWRH